MSHLDGDVCLLNGSLRADEASSFHFLNRLDKLLSRRGLASVRLAVQPGAARVYPDETLAALYSARAVVLACPLYGYCLPGGLMRLLEAWAGHARQHPGATAPRLYAIINCGFVVPETTAEALQVVRHFAARAGLEYRFAVAIACGPVARMTAPLDTRLAGAFRQIVADIQRPVGAAPPDVYLKPLVPRVFMDTIREYLDARVQRDVARQAKQAASRAR